MAEFPEDVTNGSKESGMAARGLLTSPFSSPNPTAAHHVRRTKPASSFELRISWRLKQNLKTRSTLRSSFIDSKHCTTLHRARHASF